MQNCINQGFLIFYNQMTFIRQGQCHQLNKYPNPCNSFWFVMKIRERMRSFMHLRSNSCSPIRCSFSHPSPRPPSQREGGDIWGRRQQLTSRIQEIFKVSPAFSKAAGSMGCGCPVDTSAEGRSTDRAGRRDPEPLVALRRARNP